MKSISLTVEQFMVAPAPTVFALALDTERFPRFFRGCGPVPALTRIINNSPPGIGSTRRVESSDGSCLNETITFLDPPRRHAYRLSGFRPPLSWLAQTGHADWSFDDVEAGTRVRWRYDWESSSVLAHPLTWLVLKLFMRRAMSRCLAAMAADCAATQAEPV